MLEKLYIASSMHNSTHKKLLNIAKANHPEIYALIKHNGLVELTPKVESEFFYFLAKTVVSQLLSVAAAGTIWGRINTLAETEKQTINDLFCIDYEEAVRACGLSNNKFKAICGLKNKLEQEPEFAKTVLLSDYDKVKTHITSLWGLGKWSADICAIFYCGLPDVYPGKDVAIVNGIKKLCGKTAPAEDIAKTFSPYQSYLCRHIWLGTNNGYIDSIKNTEQ